MVWKALCAIDPERDIQFVLGPVDTLDHAARRQDFGSKMGDRRDAQMAGRRFRRTLAGRDQNGCSNKKTSGRNLATVKNRKFEEKVKLGRISFSFA